MPEDSDAVKAVCSLVRWTDFIPKIPFIPEDLEVIPGTEFYKNRLPKWLDFDLLTKWVRYWERMNIKVENISTSTKYDTKDTCKKIGTSRSNTRLRLRDVERTRIFNEWAILFQEKLWIANERSSPYFRVGKADILWYYSLIHGNKL